MEEVKLQGVLDFLRAAEQLKNTLRSAHTSQGRKESTAEHTWRLCLMVMLFEAEFPEMDISKLLKMCIIHDLGEAISGDIPAVDQVPGENKALKERLDLQLLIAPLSDDLQVMILALWDEYELAQTPEAKLAKAMDKLETLLQHTQGDNPDDFDYGFNLSYGKKYTDGYDLTAKIRALIDVETKLLAGKS